MTSIVERRVSVPQSGGSIPVCIAEPARPAGSPAVLFYHGLSVDKETHAREARSLAEAGFVAVLPDAPHHGERRSAVLDEMRDAEGLAADRILLRLVDEAVEEVPALVDHMIAQGHSRVAIAGISMGAYIALAAAVRDPRLAAIVSILGSPDWTPRSGVVPPDLADVVARAPMHNASSFPPRPLLLINCGRDENVPPGPARRFAAALTPSYARAPELLVYREYPESSHFPREEDWNDLWSYTIAFLSRAMDPRAEQPRAGHTH